MALSQNNERVPSRLWAAACLGASALYWWPRAILRDEVLKIRGASPQWEADGPEHLLGSPLRKEWLFYRDKPGHRGFFETWLGAAVGGGVSRFFNMLSVQPVPFLEASPDDVSTGEDTMAQVGRVVDAETGAAVQGAMLDVWMGDPRSRMKYGDLDFDFDFRGKFKCSDDGRYTFKTLYPTTIEGFTSAPALMVVNALLLFLPGVALTVYSRLTGTPFPRFRRPPHIHCYVWAPGYETLVTQLYYLDRVSPCDLAAVNGEDPVRRTTPVANPELMVHPILSPAGGDTKWRAEFDFRLAPVSKRVKAG